ncbi:hypothetical protein ACOMHN_012182 [Nucella lapillus]
MANKRIPISIPMSVMEEYFQCSICLNVMRGAIVTLCGHRYCDRCIQEWVDRHHTCPCCNRALTPAQLVKDHQFDGLIDSCLKEKEKAESSYFESVISSAVDPGSSSGSDNTPVMTNTPVEQVLKKHLKTSLAAHELYFEDLRRQFLSKTHQLELTMRKDMERLQLDSLLPDVLNQRINELEQCVAERTSSLMKDVEQCQSLVAEAFDRSAQAGGMAGGQTGRGNGRGSDRQGGWPGVRQAGGMAGGQTGRGNGRGSDRQGGWPGVRQAGGMAGGQTGRGDGRGSDRQGEWPGVRQAGGMAGGQTGRGNGRGSDRQGEWPGVRQAGEMAGGQTGRGDGRGSDRQGEWPGVRQAGEMAGGQTGRGGEGMVGGQTGRGDGRGSDRQGRWPGVRQAGGGMAGGQTGRGDGRGYLTEHIPALDILPVKVPDGAHPGPGHPASEGERGAMYLTEHIPALDILPVKVNVVLAGKDISFADVTLRPDDVLTVIQTAVEEGLVQRGDRVIRWQPDGGRVLMVSPLSRQLVYDAGEIIEDISSGGDRFPGIQLLSWLSKPVLQCHLKPGSDLVLHRAVVCESDLPKVCYARQHKENGPSTVDYFTCKTCNFKWICRSCIQVCHKDHEIAPLVFNHKPTWACCYCPKKKKCHLQQPTS